MAQLVSLAWNQLWQHRSRSYVLKGLSYGPSLLVGQIHLHITLHELKYPSKVRMNKSTWFGRILSRSVKLKLQNKIWAVPWSWEQFTGSSGKACLCGVTHTFKRRQGHSRVTLRQADRCSCDHVCLSVLKSIVVWNTYFEVSRSRKSPESSGPDVKVKCCNNRLLLSINCLYLCFMEAKSISSLISYKQVQTPELGQKKKETKGQERRGIWFGRK